jgi:[ribosomal protein S18]-alanine N-acetyltransferase
VIAPLDDIDRIMTVMDAAFDPQFGEAWSRRQVEDSLVMGTCHYLLIDSNGEEAASGLPAAGFCLSRIGFAEEELLLFAVDPLHRGQGLGTAMLARFAEAARSRGAGRLLLEMRKGNSAESLYRRLGFVRIGERRAYYRQPDGSRIDAITFCMDFE